MKAVYVVFSSMLAMIFSFHLPSGVGTCSKSEPDFEECMRMRVEKAILRLSNGDKHLGVVPFEPLHIATIGVDENPKATVRVSQKFFNIKIHGLSATRVKKFYFDLEPCLVRAETLTPIVRTEAEYELDGRLLIFPVHARGASNVTSYNLIITHNITCLRYWKRGKEYLHLVDYKISAKPERIHYNFENLFGDNARLSEQIHKTINERAFEIYEELRPTMEESCGMIFQEIGNKIFNRVPFGEIVKD
ncbi:hypothetical protein FQR65_LT09113 [Abscondita terminalis]|nr:hypothetical protein FQR65_LT09113 [Abscondita terminalis]